MAQEEVWAPIPKIRPADCPPGLECLLAVDQVIIGFGKENKHSVNNIRGYKLFSVLDGSNCCVKNFCCNWKSYQMELLDDRGNEIVRFHRSCGCCCSSRVMRVYSPPESYIGEVKRHWGVCRKTFSVKIAQEETTVMIKGPSCFCCRIDPEYIVLKDLDTTVGRMSKTWTEIDKRFFGKQMIAGISFPMDLDVRQKIVMIAACFLAYKKCL